MHGVDAQRTAMFDRSAQGSSCLAGRVLRRVLRETTTYRSCALHEGEPASRAGLARTTAGLSVLRWAGTIRWARNLSRVLNWD